MYNRKYKLGKVEEFNHHNHIYDDIGDSIVYPVYFNVGERGWFLYIEKNWFEEYAHKIHTSIVESVEYIDDDIIVTTKNTRLVFEIVR